jgi:hypothetical protein
LLKLVLIYLMAANSPVDGHFHRLGNKNLALIQKISITGYGAGGYRLLVIGPNTRNSVGNGMQTALTAIFMNSIMANERVLLMVLL